MSDANPLKLSSLTDQLQRRSPDIAASVLSKRTFASQLLVQSHQLGEDVGEGKDHSLVQESVFDLISVFLSGVYDDVGEIEVLVKSRIRLFALLKLLSTGVVLLASAGLIFTLFGESQLASLVIGMIIFGSSLVGTFLSYLEDVHGGARSLQKIKFGLDQYAPQLKSIEYNYRFSFQSGDEDKAHRALSDLEAVQKKVTEIRSVLGLPIKAQK